MITKKRNKFTGKEKSRCVKNATKKNPLMDWTSIKMKLRKCGFVQNLNSIEFDERMFSMCNFRSQIN